MDRVYAGSVSETPSPWVIIRPILSFGKICTKATQTCTDLTAQIEIRPKMSKKDSVFSLQILDNWLIIEKILAITYIPSIRANYR